MKVTFITTPLQRRVWDSSCQFLVPLITVDICIDYINLSGVVIVKPS